MRVIYLNVNENKPPEILNITTNLNTFYKLCQCSCIDIVRRYIYGIPFDIICDDEGLLVESPKISAIDGYYRPQLVGNLIICGKADEDGKLTDLQDFDIKYILPYIKHLYTEKHPDGYYILTKCAP